MSSSTRPTGLIANSGIELLTFGTPNGHKATIILEELKESYGKTYTYQSINIMENVQKEPWFTKFSPNGRIPAVVDHDRNQFSVFEGAAILSYLVRHYDPEHKFSFEDADDLSRAEQWVAWQHGGLGPMQGQANHFFRLAKERIPYPTQRYVGESERLYGILDNQLKDRDYLVGEGRGKYSIADIANFSWVNWAYFAGINLAQFPNLNKWRLKEEPGFKESEQKLTDLANKAKEQYGYNFASALKFLKQSFYNDPIRTDFPFRIREVVEGMLRRVRQTINQILVINQAEAEAESKEGYLPTDLS
ncbi:hypothetical protein G7Y89_g8677 [Cudoniella acicularis]|uniref:Glutathione S-transferase n=1 Tax=Cudoniella acicularis TaxID=354080 RepID=A0A8H4W3C3_9HELO|nr:hypothetical protein G7Y89_g8677 [Cudoniella acicularis]